MGLSKVVCSGLVVRRKVLTTEYDIQKYVDKYGEKYERLIRNALSFIDERLPFWESELGVDINKDKFISGLIKDAKKGKVA